MPFDNRYLPYLQRVSILPIANIVHRGMSVFNASAITVIVDRWRLETHSFHMSCDEMIVTLDDMAMILGNDRLNLNLTI
jgi:hypothetical protein